MIKTPLWASKRDMRNRDNMMKIAFRARQISQLAYSIGIDILLRGVR